VKEANNLILKHLPLAEGAKDIPPDPVDSLNPNIYLVKAPKWKIYLPFALSTLAVALIAKTQLRGIQDISMKNKKVVITGGSRGLGFALAEQYLQRGARVFLCARNSFELNQAQKKLSKYGTEVHIFPCDVTNSKEVKRFSDKVKSIFNTVDVLINNAGLMEVGPMDSFSFETIQNVIDTNLLGMIRMTLDFIPLMPKGSRIVNITSIGGAVAVPHLLPYTVSKFGALGFSLGLDSELASKGISVTTILPGLMRTGSFVHANFSGDSTKEFDWFALGATLPFISISAKRAAKQIVSAGQRRKRFSVLGPQAKLLRVFYQVFPETMLGLMRIVIRLLPKMPQKGGQQSAPGVKLRQDLPAGGITELGDKAGDELNENLAS
jgi:short-subunit dehydrogenase